MHATSLHKHYKMMMTNISTSADLKDKKVAKIRRV